MDTNWFLAVLVAHIKISLCIGNKCYEIGNVSNLIFFITKGKFIMYFQPYTFSEMNYEQQQEIIEGMKEHKVEIYLGHGIWDYANNAYDINPLRSYRITPHTPLIDIPWVLIPNQYQFAVGSKIIPILDNSYTNAIVFFEDEPTYNRRSNEWDEPIHECTCDNFGCEGECSSTEFEISTNILNVSFENILHPYSITKRPDFVPNKNKIETLWKYLDNRFIAIAKDLNNYVYGYTYVPERSSDQWIKKHQEFVDLTNLDLDDIIENNWFDSLLLRNN